MIIWLYKKINGAKRISKSVSFHYHWQHRRMLKAFNNGAVKDNKEDTCYDFNIYFLGVFFSYTDYLYNFEMK